MFLVIIDVHNIYVGTSFSDAVDPQILRYVPETKSLNNITILPGKTFPLFLCVSVFIQLFKENF